MDSNTAKPQYRTLVKTLKNLHRSVVNAVGTKAVNVDTRAGTLLIRDTSSAEQVLKRAELALSLKHRSTR